jgi:hypothetical protein
VVLSPQDDDLNFEIQCSRMSHPKPAGVTVIGFTSNDSKRGSDYPKQLRTTLSNIAAFNRDAERFSEEIAQQGKPLSQPTPAPIAKTLAYLDRLFTAADWLGRYHRRCFTMALRARYLLWALMAFLLIAFKKDSIGQMAMVAITGVLSVFLLGTLLAVWAHKREWHRKYLDYRALAEALRVDFYWEVAGVRSEFEGDFAHESFLQKQDAELQWIRSRTATSESRGCAGSGISSWQRSFDLLRGRKKAHTHFAIESALMKQGSLDLGVGRGCT